MYSDFINIYIALILDKILYSSLANNLLHTTSFKKINEKENEVSCSVIPHVDNTPKVCVCMCVYAFQPTPLDLLGHTRGPQGFHAGWSLEVHPAS